MEQKRHLELLIENFEKRLSSSRDKKTLLTKEIEAHEMLFDEKKLPLPLEIHTNRRPIKGLHYTDGVINQLRDAYYKYIVQGASYRDWETGRTVVWQIKGSDTPIDGSGNRGAIKYWEIEPLVVNVSP